MLVQNTNIYYYSDLNEIVFFCFCTWWLAVATALLNRAHAERLNESADDTSITESRQQVQYSKFQFFSLKTDLTDELIF